MIEERGIVRGREDSYALVETARQSLCGGCGATMLCGSLAGGKPVLTVRAKDPVGAEVGEAVTLGVSERAFLKTAFLIYLGPVLALLSVGILAQRSEERRVGKEGRSRWSPYP